MTGPEHYWEAEQQLGYAADSDPGSEKQDYHLRVAAVRATLAVAAATAVGTFEHMPADDSDAWLHQAAVITRT